MIAFNSGFGRVGGVVVDNVPEDGLDYAIHESFVEFEQLRSKTAIAFSNVYEADMLDSTKDSVEKEAVFEGLVGDVFEKIKEFFKTIGQKIKSWFMNVKRFLESYFMNNKKFVEKYRNELTSKDLSKFTFDGGHEWNLEDIKKFQDKAAAGTNVATDRAKKLQDRAKNDADDFNKTENGVEDKKFFGEKDVEEEIDKAVGFNNVGKFKEAMVKELRKEKNPLKNVNIQKIIEYVTDKKETLSGIEENFETIKETCDTAIEDIGKFEGDLSKNKFDDTEEGKKKKARNSTITTFAKRVADWHRHALGYQQAVASTNYSLVKQRAGEAMSICRAVLSYKPANESWSAARESSTATILDSYGY